MDKENIKYMDIKEFREKGYLQELNRRFLHPLGLALEVSIDSENGNERLSGIWDYRDDETGIILDIKNSDKERKNKFKKNKDHIDNEIKKRYKKRQEKLGYFIELIQ